MSLEDTIIRRRIFLQRFAGSEARKAERELIRIYKEIQARLLREPGEFQAGRLSKLRDDIDKILGRNLDTLTDGLFDMAQEVGEHEAAFLVKAMQLETSVLLAVPEIAVIQRALTLTGLDVPVGPSQLTMKEALIEFSKGKQKGIRQILNDGILLGDSTQDVAKKIAQEARLRPKHQVNALTRTLINHSSSMANKAAAMENKALLSHEEWSAVLDNRTTLICGGRDGNLYPVGRGPYPPAHWNCRSIRVPVVKSEFSDKPIIKTESNFDTWLTKQSADFQDNYFSQFADGKEKAALFRRGGLDIQQFRDETGKNFTLEQLSALEPLAFQKAGITAPVGP